MTIPTVTVTGSYEDAEGNPATGTVTFKLKTPLQDSTDPEVTVTRTPVVATLVNGSFSQVLSATSGGDILPTSGVLYTVTEQITGSRTRRRKVAFPSSSPTVDMADVLPVDDTGVVWEPGVTAAEIEAALDAAASGASGDFAVQQITELAKRQFESLHWWARENDADLFVGETGVMAPTTPAAEADRWNAIAYDLLDYLAAKEIPAFVWSARKTLRPTDVLDPYKASGGLSGTLDTILSNATPYEEGPATLRGVNVSDGHVGYLLVSETGGYSNVNRGTFGTDYTYGAAGDFAFLYGRGYRYIRLTVRMERLAPTLGAALDATELTRVTTAVNAAGAAGLQAILALKNHGAYYQDVAGTSTRRVLGSAEFTEAHFVDFWDRMSTAFKDNAYVYGYDLDNEPVNPAVADWHSASQAALSAIRANGDTKLILVEGGGAGYSGVETWVQDNGADGWITDPDDNFAYSPHWYAPGFYQVAEDFISLDETAHDVADDLRVYARAEGEQQFDALVQTMPVPSGGFSTTSGTMWICYFDSHLDQLTSQLVAYTSTGGSGLTLARLGLAIVTNFSGDLRCLAESASNPASWEPANATITEPFSTARGGAETVRLVKGQRYAALLIVVGTSPPTLAGQGFTITGMGGQVPKIAMKKAGLTDLPTPGSTITAASMAQAGGRVYVAVKP